jgi:hypothetical protein
MDIARTLAALLVAGAMVPVAAAQPTSSRTPTHAVFNTNRTPVDPWLALRDSKRTLIAKLADGTPLIVISKAGPSWEVEVAEGSDAGKRGFANSKWIRPLFSDEQAIVAATRSYVPNTKVHVSVEAVEGDYARVRIEPVNGETDPALVYLTKKGGAWRGITVGTDFDERDLLKHGVPRKLLKWTSGGE